MKKLKVSLYYFCLACSLFFQGDLFAENLDQVKRKINQVIHSFEAKNSLKEMYQLEEDQFQIASYEENVRRSAEPRSEKKQEAQKQEYDEQKEDVQALDKAIESESLEKGSAHLENGKLKKAYFELKKNLKQENCDEASLAALQRIAEIWQFKKSKRKKALHIYLFILRCKPEDPEVLFRTARLLAWEGKKKDAEKMLRHLLEVSPNYLDGVSFLFNLYLNQRKWKQAQEVLKTYPNTPDEKKLRARLDFRRRNFSSSEKQYRELVEIDPEDIDSRRALARSLAGQNKFKEAKKQYEVLVKKEPKNHQNWVELMDVRSHTDVSLIGEGNYTKGKENDPDLQAPVVTDYYTYGAVHCLIPILNRWRIDLKDIYYHNKQNDIYFPMGLNYNVYVYGAQMTSSVLIWKSFQWDLILRYLGARGYNNHVFFPFKSTSRFEPGTSFIYSTPLMFALVNAHVESFVMKNFAKFRSELMRTIHLHAVYIIRPNVYMKPEFETNFTEIFYKDSIHNYQNILNLWARFDLFTKYIKFVYQFRQSNFKEPNENYYSYKLQFRNSIGGIISLDFFSPLLVECYYQHWWKYSAALDQPIGLFVFQADRQWIQADKIEMKAIYRFRDCLRLEAYGHLLFTTLPYRNYKAGGKITWQF